LADDLDGLWRVLAWALEPPLISIADASELVTHTNSSELAECSISDVVLGERTDESINGVNILIGSLEARDDGGVRRDVLELGLAWEIECSAEVIVADNSEVTGTLNVECDKIDTSR